MGYRVVKALCPFFGVSIKRCQIGLPFSQIVPGQPVYNSYGGSWHYAIYIPGSHPDKTFSSSLWTYNVNRRCTWWVSPSHAKPYWGHHV